MGIDWRGWVITDEQAERIREGDISARNAFYFDNLERIRKMAWRYTEKHPRLHGWVDDMVSGVYVDLGFFKQENGKPVVDGCTLSCFVYCSFRFCPYGGLLYLSENDPKMLSGGGLAVYSADCVSFDSPVGSMHNAARHHDDASAQTLGDIVPAPDLFRNIDFTDLTDDLKAVVADCLSKRQAEYFGYFIEGYGNAEISRRMGYSGESNCAADMRNKLRKNYAVILPRLSALGIDITPYTGLTPYNPKAERVYKLSPEVRAYWAQKARERRARKRGVSPDLPPAS